MDFDLFQAPDSGFVQLVRGRFQLRVGPFDGGTGVHEPVPLLRSARDGPQQTHIVQGIQVKGLAHFRSGATLGTKRALFSFSGRGANQFHAPFAFRFRAIMQQRKSRPTAKEPALLIQAQKLIQRKF